MISGTLPNNTVWWISRDGKKVWIESKEIENQKFTDKGYDIIRDRIFASKPRRQIGEMTGSRLERRMYKDSWLIQLEAFLDIYPNLLQEIEEKSVEELTKKKPTRTKRPTKRSNPPRPITPINKNINNKDNRLEYVDEKLIEKNQQELKEMMEKSYFEITHPYIDWIKCEIDKSPDGELKVFSDEMQEKMGEDYRNMHIMRIYFGLKKVLSEINIDVELGKYKKQSALIMRKVKNNNGGNT